MTHYFKHNPDLKSDLKTFRYDYRGIILNLVSDSGVFSKAGVDFGSSVLINAIDNIYLNGKIIDLGCGYGPIGLSIAKCYPECFVTMVDVNEKAVELSQLNASNNNISNVDIKQSNILDAVTGEFNTIITNPPIRAGKETVFSFYKQAYEHLLPGGHLFIVIQKKQGAPSTIKYLETMFSEVVTITKEKGYYVVMAVKGLTM